MQIIYINHFIQSYSTPKQQKKILQHSPRHQDYLQSVSVQSSSAVVQTCDYWVGSEQTDFHYSLFTQTTITYSNQLTNQ